MPVVDTDGDGAVEARYPAEAGPAAAHEGVGSEQAPAEGAAGQVGLDAGPQAGAVERRVADAAPLVGLAVVAAGLADGALDAFVEDAAGGESCGGSLTEGAADPVDSAGTGCGVHRFDGGGPADGAGPFGPHDGFAAGQSDAHAAARLDEGVRVPARGVAGQHTTGGEAHGVWGHLRSAEEVRHAVPHADYAVVEDAVDGEPDRPGCGFPHLRPQRADRRHGPLERRHDVLQATADARENRVHARVQRPEQRRDEVLQRRGDDRTDLPHDHGGGLRHRRLRARHRRGDHPGLRRRHLGSHRVPRRGNHALGLRGHRRAEADHLRRLAHPHRVQQAGRRRSHLRGHARVRLGDAGRRIGGDGRGGAVRDDRGGRDRRCCGQVDVRCGVREPLRRRLHRAFHGADADDETLTDVAAVLGEQLRGGGDAEGLLEGPLYPAGDAVEEKRADPSGQRTDAVQQALDDVSSGVPQPAARPGQGTDDLVLPPGDGVTDTIETADDAVDHRLHVGRIELRDLVRGELDDVSHQPERQVNPRAHLVELRADPRHDRGDDRVVHPPDPGPQQIPTGLDPAKHDLQVPPGPLEGCEDHVEDRSSPGVPGHLQAGPDHLKSRPQEAEAKLDALPPPLESGDDEVHDGAADVFPRGLKLLPDPREDRADGLEESADEVDDAGDRAAEFFDEPADDFADDADQGGEDVLGEPRNDLRQDLKQARDQAKRTHQDEERGDDDAADDRADDLEDRHQHRGEGLHQIPHGTGDVRDGGPQGLADLDQGAEDGLDRCPPGRGDGLADVSENLPNSADGIPHEAGGFPQTGERTVADIIALERGNHIVPRGPNRLDGIDHRRRGINTNNPGQRRMTERRVVAPQ